MNKKQRSKTMKKILYSMCIFGFFVNAFGAETSTEDFFYQRGYENGFASGFEEGVRKAMEESKRMLEIYGNELKAYEIGKYLIKTQNLTYPQVWQEVDETGAIKLRIIPSRIEKELNIDELFAKFVTIPTIAPYVLEKGKLSLNEKNSVYLSDRDSNINEMPQNVNAQSNKQTLSIKKSSKNLDILKKANVVFSDEGKSYNVLFFTKQEKQDFCNQYEICK